MLFGHHDIFDALTREAQTGTLGHAYIFLGPESVGKTKTALELADYLQNPKKDPVVRQHILTGTDSDTLIFLDDGKVLPIKTIREIIERLHQSHERPYLVVILENLGRLKTESVNALLKSLEEPPDGVIFFLTAHRLEDVLPTLASRARTVRFHDVGDTELKEMTDGHPLSEDLLRFSMGKPGKLYKLMHDENYLKAHLEMKQILSEFLEAPTVAAALKIARDWEKHPELPELLDMLIQDTRRLAKSEQLAESLSSNELATILDQMITARYHLDHNVNKRLLLDNLLLAYTS